MTKKTKLYAAYAAAVLAVGTVYAMLSPAERHKEADNGRVVFTVATTSVSSPLVSSTAVKTTKVKTITTKAAKTTTAKVTTVREETEPTEPVVLWFELNEASAEQLALLPGIGEKLAEEIVSYRSSIGGFRNIEELMNVSGIGESKFAAVREFIYVNDPVYDEEVAVSESVPDEEQTQEETEHIPTLEDVAPIDLNTASKEELMLLPYVDDDIAEKIISFREQAGGYSHPYELLYIEGLTREKVAEIMNYVKAGDNE